jgi:hypothetical protein
MANEINIQALLSLQRDETAVQASGNWPIDQAATDGRGVSKLVKATTSFAEVTFDIGTVGYLFAKNLDGSQTINLATGDDVGVFAKLRPSEFCLVPVNQSNVYVKRLGGSTDTDVQFLAVEL